MSIEVEHFAYSTSVRAAGGGILHARPTVRMR